ncbi:hypothetical protein CJO66_33990 [Burkholderia ubonensis]|nr:hypothetical protein CJO70_33230 [Burkholderia ubonensis]PAJ90580.1 hypothetical protein CJO69_30545 [Burkholderia ubonensis]PAK04053.1 hypothetical protein CJO67_32450 [Burkholderia ubonensis]PAK10552.1 hypothetical protein CJO66_33990 [Burkholderia ubonensis]RQP76137.1 hypothetical protein DF013_12455 [Burkholderia ubonensis]
MIHVSVSFRSEDGNAFRMSAACATQREILTCALLSQIRHPLYIRMAKAAAAARMPVRAPKAPRPAISHAHRDIHLHTRTFPHPRANSHPHT